MAKKISIYNKITTYIKKNPDIITLYSTTTGYYLKDEIINIEKFLSNNNIKTSFVNINSLLNTFLPLAISKKCNLMSVIEKYLDENKNTVNSDNLLKLFFNDIEKIYNKNNNCYDIEFNTENRDKLIEMNLKTVISIAKKFLGMGLELGDLIGAGNLGLCVAFDKFNPNKNSIKDNILNDINNIQEEIINTEILKNIIYKYITYGKLLYKFNKYFIKDTYTKDEICLWVQKNIYNAKFNSVASMWIEAYIRIEILNNGKLIKKTKKDLKDCKNIIVYNLSDPISDTSTFEDVLNVVKTEEYELDILESKKIFRDKLNLLFDCVDVRGRRIIMKKFGIGYPRALTPKEISDTENLSSTRASQIIYSTLDIIKNNAIKFNIDSNEMYALLT